MLSSPSIYSGVPAISLQRLLLPFFHLHQQYYYSTRILLHRPFAYNNITTPTPDGRVAEREGSDDSSALSQTICFDSAIWVARIFKRHRQKFSSRPMFFTNLQHAGTAAIALTAGIASIEDIDERIEPLRHLDCLVGVIAAMSTIYKPAEQMLNLLNRTFEEYGWELDGLQHVTSKGVLQSIPGRMSRREGLSYEPTTEGQVPNFDARKQTNSTADAVRPSKPARQVTVNQSSGSYGIAWCGSYPNDLEKGEEIQSTSDGAWQEIAAAPEWPPDLWAEVLRQFHGPG